MGTRQARSAIKTPVTETSPVRHLGSIPLIGDDCLQELESAADVRDEHAVDRRSFIIGSVATMGGLVSRGYAAATGASHALKAASVTPKQLVIVGATGMVGGYALRDALQDPNVATITSIGRRKVGLSHPKLKEVLHRDFADCSALATTLTGQDAVVFCLGAYTGSVSDSELRRITVDYTIEFARVLRASSPQAAFAFLSGSGADPSGRSRIAFALYKGEAEKALLAAGFPRLYLFRPGYIYPVQPRKEPNWGYRLMRELYPALRVLFPNHVIRADDLARVMVDVAVERTAQHENVIYENREIRELSQTNRPLS